MLLLGVDTSGKNGSLALVKAKDPDQGQKPRECGARPVLEVLELVPLVGRMYSAQLIPELQNALARQNLKKTDIDAYVVAAGPGSFTGLRVGLSTVKGLSEVLHKPIVAVSVLEAAARTAKVAGRVVVALDAGRKQVFVGDYEFDEEFTVRNSQESLVALEEFIRSMKAIDAKACSPDAAVREAALERVTVCEISSPQADVFAKIGYHKLRRGETTPAEVLEANYIRASDAELFSLPKLTQ